MLCLTDKEFRAISQTENIIFLIFIMTSMPSVRVTPLKMEKLIDNDGFTQGGKTNNFKEVTHCVLELSTNATVFHPHYCPTSR